jgi:very-short-patch-repair endonuclease
LIGYRSTSILIDELIHDLENLLLRANKFYDDMNDFYENPYEFIPEALNIEFDSPFDSSLPGELKLLQDQINLGKIPFLDSSETILEVLTDPDNLQINDFYDPFVSIRKEKLHLEEQFKFTDYNYNVRKKEIESYNSLELATQIDERVINFADDFQNDAKTLSVIISKKKKFPKDKFDILKSAFPCIICSLRDYAEYIPLEREIFDLIIIDEASTVSIAQAFPAIIRAKKMIVLGDKKQFSNVKTSNASKEINNRRFSEVKKALGGGVSEFTSDLEIRIEKLNISNSILDFMENLSNFDIMLRKHFRGYPEMISFSSKYFYGNSLQAMKIRGKSIKDVLEFIEIKHSGNLDIYKNTNEQEINVILNRVLLQLEQGDYRTVAVLTPFTEQQILISKIFSEHEKYEEILAKLRFRSFTFDSCQGEERDIIYYSFVASPEKDHLKHILPKSIDRKNEEELDKDKKLKRINVAFSRGKEKLIFVHSKPISDFSGGREILNHYKTEIANAHILPTHADVDQNSEAEKRVLDWLIQSPMYMEYKPEIVPQFELGKYLKSLDQKYSHPMYRVDFLLRFTINNKQIDIVVEYDGFEYHFNNREEVDAGNWKTYLTDKDIEREHILESYGYKVIRLNKFNIGKDPIKTISDKIEDHINQDTGTYDALTSDVIDSTKIAHNGLQNGTYKVCKKCNSSLPIEKFLDHKAKTGIGRLCNNCKSSNSRKRYKKRYL